jgi:adenosine kinase
MSKLSPPQIVVAASMAFDTIMVFEDRFSAHVLPDQIHQLNVSFFSPTLRKEFGGCAGNIAYNLHLLGENPIPVAMVGQDFGPYQAHLEACGIRTEGLHVAPSEFTAQCFIVTDLANNQIAAFHPGAMRLSHQIDASAFAPIACALVGPDAKEAMQLHAQQLRQAHIPLVLDPGQNTPLFSGAELLNWIEGARVLVCNDYEAQLIQEKTQLSLEVLAHRVQALVVTQGDQGSVLYEKGRQHHIPALPVEAIHDPTGCGDAYRAGLLWALVHGHDLVKGAQLGSVLGALKIAVRGCQNHAPSSAAIRTLYERHFGDWPNPSSHLTP